MKRKATATVSLRPSSHTLSPVSSQSDTAVDRVIASMNRKLKNLETKYQDLLSQCQDFRRLEQGEPDRDTLRQLESQRDSIDSELQQLLKDRKNKLVESEEGKDSRSTKVAYDSISEALKTAQSGFVRLLNLATVSEYQAKTQAIDLFVTLSDAFWAQVKKLKAGGDKREWKGFVTEVQKLEQERQLLDMKITEINEGIRQRYSAQLLRARQRLATVRSDNVLLESQLKTVSRQVSSACSSPAGGTSTAFTLSELNSPLHKDSSLRFTGPLHKPPGLRLAFRPAQSERNSLSPLWTMKRTGEDCEDKRIEEIRKEMDTLKTQLAASVRERKKQLFHDSNQFECSDNQKKMSLLMSSTKNFIRISKDIIRSAHNSEAEEALKTLTRLVNDILRDGQHPELRRNTQIPAEWLGKYALERSNKILEEENKRLEDALNVEKTRADRLIEMVEAFKKDIQPKSTELVAKLTKEVRQLTVQKQSLEKQLDQQQLQLADLHSDYHSRTEEIKLLRSSKSELLRSSQLRDSEIKGKVRSEVVKFAQSWVEKLTHLQLIMETKVENANNRIEELKNFVIKNNKNGHFDAKRNKKIEFAEKKAASLLMDLNKEREITRKLSHELEILTKSQQTPDKIAEKQRNIDNLQSKIHSLSLEIAQLRYEKGVFEDKNIELTSEIAQLRDQIDPISCQNEEIIEEISSKFDEKMSLEVDLAAEIPSNLPENELKEKCEELENELISEKNKHLTEIKELKSIQNAVIQENIQLKDAFAALKTAENSSPGKIEVRKSLNEAVKRNETVENELIRLQEKLKTSLEAENTHKNTLQAKITELEIENDRLKAVKIENERLKSAISGKKSGLIEDYEMRIGNFREQLRTLTGNCEKIEQEKEKIKTEMERERDLLNAKMRILTVSMQELTENREKMMENERKLNEICKINEEKGISYDKICEKIVEIGKEIGEFGENVDLILSNLLDFIVKNKRISHENGENLESRLTEDCFSTKQAYNELLTKYQALDLDWKQTFASFQTQKTAWESEKTGMKQEYEKVKTAFERLEDDYFALKVRQSQEVTELQEELAKHTAKSQPNSPSPGGKYVKPELKEVEMESEESLEESVVGTGEVVKTVEYDGNAWNLVCSGNRAYQWMRLDGVETCSEKDTSTIDKIRELLLPICPPFLSIEDALSSLILEVTELRKRKTIPSLPVPHPLPIGSARPRSSPYYSDRKDDDQNSFEVGEGHLGLTPPLSFGISSRDLGSGRSDLNPREEQIGRYLQMINDLRDEVETLRKALESEQSDNKRLEEMLHLLRDELRATGNKEKAQGESLLPHIRIAIVGLAVELPKLSPKGEGLLKTIYSHFEFSAKQIALLEQGRKTKKGEKSLLVTQVLS